MANNCIHTTEEFSLELVKLIVEKGRSIPSVALDLGVHEKTLYKWVSDYKKDNENAFPGSGRLRPEDEIIRQLKRRVADLEQENAILKKAAAIFANHRK